MRPLRPLLMATTGTLLLSLTLPGASTTAATVSSPIGTVTVESHGTAPTPSDGDLWPSCWAANDKLYTANGDGSPLPSWPPYPPSWCS